MILVPFTLDHAAALIRIVAGLLLVGHGAQKLFGAFGGHGIRAVAAWLGSLGVPAPTAFAWFVGLCEFLGGLLFAVGLLSPIAARPRRSRRRPRPTPSGSSRSTHPRPCAPTGAASARCS